MKKSEKMVEIVLYKPEYKNDFIRLNKEWIETYFTIEASDIETFSHVDDIIEQGGQIFIALHDGEVVGCCALKYHDEKQSYELAKMAVSPQHQGKPCMKCVSVCPTGARGIGVIMNFLATQGRKKVCATRKVNELYL